MRNLLSKKFVCARLLAVVFFSIQISYAEQAKFKPLDKNFAKDFQIENTEGLSGRILLTAEINGFERILLLDIDNRKLLKIIDGPGNNSFPSWAPDGRRFAFTSDRDGNQEIYTANFNGKILSRVTSNKVTDHNASWSKDGKELLYYSETGKKGGKPITNIFSYSFSSGQSSQITKFKKGKNSTPQLSPDGNLIAFSTNRFWPGWDICIWNRSRKSEECILTGTKSYCRPMWSASGKLLAYSGGAFKSVDIGIFNIENRSRKLITEISGKEYDVVWSPSGRELAFASEVKTDVYNIFVDRQLKSTPLLSSPYSTRYLSWSPITTLELEAKKVNAKGSKDEEEKLLHPLFME